MPGSRVAPEDGDTVIPVSELEVSDLLDAVAGSQAPRPASASIRDDPALAQAPVAGAGSPKGTARLSMLLFDPKARERLGLRALPDEVGPCLCRDQVDVEN